MPARPDRSPPRVRFRSTHAISECPRRCGAGRGSNSSVRAGRGGTFRCRAARRQIGRLSLALGGGGHRRARAGLGAAAGSASRPARERLPAPSRGRRSQGGRTRDRAAALSRPVARHAAASGPDRYPHCRGSKPLCAGRKTLSWLDPGVGGCGTGRNRVGADAGLSAAVPGR